MRCKPIPIAGLLVHELPRFFDQKLRRAFLAGLGNSVTLANVFLDGAATTVTYSGPAPGYPGLDQINFQLPAEVTSGTVVVVAGRTRAIQRRCRI